MAAFREYSTVSNLYKLLYLQIVKKQSLTLACISFS